MKKPIIIFMLLIFGFCCDDENPVSSSNPFEGAWDVSLAGDLSGGGDFNIGSDGQFSDVWNLNTSSGSYTTTISGSVTKTGEVSGDIYISSSKVGSFSGTLSENSGSGIYQLSQPQQLSGVWAATETF